MSKILITGYKGYIGSHLLPQLSKHNVRGWDVEEEGDIFDDSVRYLVEWADIVIHLAANTSVSESFKYPEMYLYTNVLGTARMAQLCMRYKKKLIYISSAAYNDPFSSPYAQSKFMAEHILIPFLEFMKIVILRPENIYGGIPKQGTMMHHFEFDAKLTINGDGEQTRDFIHIHDFVDIIKASFSSKWNGKVIQIGSGKSISVNEIAELFSKYTGKKIVHKKEVSEVRDSVADVRLLKRLYGKKPMWKINNYIKSIYKEKK